LGTSGDINSPDFIFVNNIAITVTLGLGIKALSFHWKEKTSIYITNSEKCLKALQQLNLVIITPKSVSI
jgi:hypothetical protein